MKKITFNNQLPLTIQEARITEIEDKDKKPKENFIAVKKLQSNFVSPENFYKPISKMIAIDGNE